MPFLTEASKSIVPLWINGTASPLDTNRLIPITSSKQNRIVHYAQGATPSDARAAADAAWTAFASWKKTKYTHRRDLLLKVAELYVEKEEELVKWQVTETSCTETYARFNVKLAVDLVRECAGSLVGALTGEVPPMMGEGIGLVVKEPVGPVLVIPPWNSSIILSTRGVAAAIAAGCTVVMKASEACPRTHNLVVEVFEEAGLPTGCINQIQAARNDAAAVAEALISHQGIRKVEFIGSATVGRLIGQVAAKHLKPVLMELGGKGPAIVLKDADLKRAAALCAFGAFLHHGQICFSTERILVVREVADAFTKILQEEVQNNYAGEVGTAVDKKGAQHAHEIIRKAIDGGAYVVAGDNSFIDKTEVSLKPTIIGGVKPTDDIWDEEAFGPSASLYVVDNEEEAIKLANISSYGLSATIHTTNYLRGMEMARDLDYGQVHINVPTVYDQTALPVSGVKGSGWGNNNGHYGLAEFLVDKTITVHSPNESVAFGS